MKKRKSAADAACPCGSGLPYERCCAPFHKGDAAPTPEALMRSRYSAYALGLNGYVEATWDGATRPAVLFEPGEERPKWLSLEVLDAPAPEGDDGLVRYRARGRTSRGAFRMTERSRFVRRGGRWFYVDGEFEED